MSAPGEGGGLVDVRRALEEARHAAFTIPLTSKQRAGITGPIDIAIADLLAT